MKRLAVIMLALACMLPARAQVAAQVPPGYMLVDSLVFTPLAVVDTTLDGRSIFNSMPEGVSVHQSGLIRNVVEARVMENRDKLFTGYRIRIFFDNGQNARGASSAALYRFKTLHPGVSAYRSFTNPYFKVTVGDYRTKSDAMAALSVIRRQFPSAFIIKERFKYPAIKDTRAFRVDTVQVLRRID